MVEKRLDVLPAGREEVKIDVKRSEEPRIKRARVELDQDNMKRAYYMLFPRCDPEMTMITDHSSTGVNVGLSRLVHSHGVLRWARQLFVVLGQFFVVYDLSFVVEGRFFSIRLDREHYSALELLYDFVAEFGVVQGFLEPKIRLHMVLIADLQVLPSPPGNQKSKWKHVDAAIKVIAVSWPK
ncbi:hypothetical protein AK812_SmicGene10334 [Symbiodinium microadriaticum]|uniref:Uncharacterized protein n=1 Tax=Symbiodinium microadriaticum TaxID=2951 RepID=A0A1Q9EG88_SYMMI|nr:hypothetical protein AK812_SmicGene10334 [Symbiodinium microadriaticum]